MHGKGATAYREQNHVPMHVVHPDVGGGRSCAALTSHLDILPTLVSMAGGDESRKSEMLNPLKGRDFSGLLNHPGTAGVNELRDAALYNFNMLIYQDPDFTSEAFRIIRELGPEGPKEIKRRGLKPDLAGRRGAIRSVFDGRYKFSRYFSTLQHNKPQTLEELVSVNDIELYDHAADPTESVNLATEVEGNRDLIMTMNGKLNTIIGEEVGVDDGSSLGLKAETEFGFSKIDI
jgi:arylsulfatase